MSVDENKRDDHRLSELPDHLLISIISHLPASDLVRTSGLARRWRLLYTQADRLDFRAAPTRVINSVLCRHTGNLPTCRVEHDCPRKKDVCRWISMLSEKGVRQLALRFSRSRGFVFPSRIFGDIQSLRELELHECKLFDPSPLSGCHGLRSLRLSHSSLNDDALALLIDACPQLGLLGLWKCTGLKNPKIRSRTLSRLEVESIAVQTIEINTPALTILTINYITNIDHSMILDAPSLVVLNTSPVIDERYHAETRRAWLSLGHCNVEMLSLWTGLYRKTNSNLRIDARLFINLRRLTLNVNLNDIRQSVVLAFVLGECLRLMELGIEHDSTRLSKSDHSCLPYRECDFWERRLYVDCLEFSLEQVWVRNFTGLHQELEFVKFVLSKSKVLKRLTLMHGECSTTSMKHLQFLKLEYSYIDMELRPQTNPLNDVNISPDKFTYPAWI